MKQDEISDNNLPQNAINGNSFNLFHDLNFLFLKFFKVFSSKYFKVCKVIETLYIYILRIIFSMLTRYIECKSNFIQSFFFALFTFKTAVLL